MEKFLQAGKGRFFFPVLISLVACVVAYLNYIPGTILSGWDNLHTEFNYSINIARSLSTAWQEYQGLGLVGGMGHGANLVREVILLFLSFVFPQNFIRYLWHFLMLIAGPVGVYFFLSQVLERKELFINKIASFTGGMFYLFNLATVQYYFVPFESFSSFYGLSPWALFALVRYLNLGGRKNLLFLFAMSLLATSGFLVQTFFVVFAIVVAFLLLNYFLKERKESLKKVIPASLTILATNLFWFFPVAYFSLTNVNVVDEAKINSIATVETQYQNQDFGDLGNIARLKGFWLEYLDWQGEDFDRLLLPWQEHLQEPFTNDLLLVFFVAAIVGVAIGSVLKVSRYRVGLYGILFFTVLMLSSGKELLVSMIPLLGQIFRSPFTKVSPVLAFALAWGLAMFVMLFSRLIPRGRKTLALGISIYMVILFMMSVSPVFEGKLISSNMKLKPPDAYFELYEYMEEQPKESRVAFFPIQSFWGWNFYDWGYRGSGFLWYGIEQPMLDRAFDVWSKYNENFYQEASTALYSEQDANLQQVFDKYDVSYVLLDESVVIPGGNNDQLKYDYIKEVLPQIGGEVVWEEDFLTLYKLPNFNDSFVKAPESYTVANGPLDYVRRDVIYDQNGNYISGNDRSSIYPFSYLSKESLTDEVEYSDTSMKLISEINLDDSQPLTIPGYQGEYKGAANVTLLPGQVVVDFEQPYSINADRSIITQERIIPKLTAPIETSVRDAAVWVNNVETQIGINGTKRIDGVSLTQGEGLNIKMYDKSRSLTTSLAEDFYANSFTPCWEREGQEGFVEGIVEDGVYKVRARDAAGCNAMRVGLLVKDALVSVKLPFKSDGGARPHFCFQLEGTSECLHDDVFYHSTTSREWKVENREFLIPQDGNYWLVVMGRPPDERGETWEIEYRAPEIELTAQLSSVDFVPSIFDPLWNDSTYKIPEGTNTLSVSLPLIGENVNFSQFRGDHTSNCDVLDRGFAEKITRGETVYYQAEEYGAICDFAAVNLPTDKEFLMRVRGDNDSGRSLKLFLYNPVTGRNDLELLVGEGQFDNTYSVLSWPNEAKEYTLTVENRSYGQLSQNKLDSVTFYAFPNSWLSEWRVGAVQETKNDLTVVDSNRSGTAFYTIKTEGNGLLELSQGYDDGWVAYAPSAGYLEHVKVNSWANGWIVPEGEHTVYIFFWPQYLQWFGFGALILAPIIIIKGIKLPKVKVDKLLG